MDTKILSDFIAWSKTTDLQEIVCKKDGSCVEIKTAQAAAPACDFAGKLSAVTAPAIGIFRGGQKGKEIILKENMPVKKGALLGVIEINKTQSEVISPTGGILKIIAVRNGQSAEYGQPLFFIEPK